MKMILALALTLITGAGAAGAQQPAGDRSTARQTDTSARAASPAELPAVAPPSATAIELATNLRDATPWLNAPDVAPVAGPLVVAAGESMPGPMVVNGQLDVFGTIQGDAMTIAGNLVVHPGGSIIGRAIAVAGDVAVAEGARVAGAVQSVQGHAASTVPPPSAGERIRHSLVNVLTWLALVIVLGVGVLVFAAEQMETVTRTLAQSVRRSFLAGLLGQMALMPALILIVVVLAITVIGVLLIPIAIVGYTVIAAGLLVLGLLSASLLVGSALGARGSDEDDESSRRRRALRALLVGVGILFAPWLLASLLTATPVAGSIVHAAALLVTWVAVTAGFGAVIRSRAGRRVLTTPSVVPLPIEDEVSWQTPTPVGGVAAARRPTPARPARSGGGPE